MNHGLSISLIHPILSYMLRTGHDLESFFRFASFDKHTLENAEARIREEEYDRLLEAASNYTNDKQFGLRSGQTIEISGLGILGYVLLHCRTIGEALAAYRRYNVILCSGIDVEWESGGRETTILFKLSNPDRRASRHAVEGMVSSLYHVLLKLSCRSIALRGLQFMHEAPEDRTEYATIVGINPVFGSVDTVIRLDNEVLQYPIVLANSDLLSTFETYAEEARNRLLVGQTFSDQVYRWITRCMPSAFPSVTDAARHFNVSVRTMQANLKQEDTTYNRLFNKARMEFAVHYLRNPRFTVAEVAYLLQFSEPSAFQSAFKRWKGMPPGQFREANEIRKVL